MPKPKTYGVPINNNDYRKVVADLEHSDLTRSRKSVLRALADHTDENGYCFPSQKRIAKKERMHIRTVQRALPELLALKYIRKVSRTKTGFRNGSCAYAVTVPVGIPTRHHVEGTRQLVIPEPDTVTELNKSIEQTIKQRSDPIRLVGDKLLEILKPVIDFSESPRMISTTSICKRLFNSCLPSDFEATLENAFKQARLLRKEYELSDKKVTSWSPLIMRMQAEQPGVRISRPSNDQEADEPLPPLIEELKSLLPASVRKDAKINLELKRLTAVETPDAIEFSSASRLALDQVYERAGQALRLLANSYGKTVLLKHYGTVVHQVTVT